MRIAIVCFFVAVLALAAPQEFVSGPARTHLIELFTSEGCSSCPPAEAWFATLRREPGLWRDFVPLAWHVDYWDRLGWKDRFASKANTARQYAYAEAWHGSSVYTPCFVLDGQEWHDRLVPHGSHDSAGELHASYDEGKVAIRFTPANGSGTRPQVDYEAHATILAMGVASKVTAGENSGRELQHHFVVVVPVETATLKNSEAHFELPRPKSTGASDFALAVWITSSTDAVPVQATCGLLER